jgi:DNA-binding MarR family transcriptional regulator
MYKYLMNQDNHPSSELLDLSSRLEEATRASQTANDMFDETLTQFLGINRTDGRCIDIIDRAGRVTAGQLAAETGLSTGAVTIVLDRLEAAGYVRRVRDTADRRKVFVEMTESIKRITERIFAHYGRIGPLLMQRFSPAELEAIIQYLEMSAWMNREMAFTLKDHVRAAADIDTRLIEARAFERAVVSQTPRVNAALTAIMRGQKPGE